MSETDADIWDELMPELSRDSQKWFDERIKKGLKSLDRYEKEYNEKTGRSDASYKLGINRVGLKELFIVLIKYFDKADNE